ncbi:TPA: transporter substrate-binding domain-containing protein [Klebsiella pneumoniae]
MQKTTLLLAVALAFSASSWAQDVKINGTGVSLEANKTPIHTAKNPQAIALLPKDLHLAVPGKFTVAVAALNSPPLTVFADDNKTLLGSETDIARLVAESLGLEVNVVPTSWEDWPLGVTSGKYDAAISNITVTKERKEKFDFATYRVDSLAFSVKSTSDIAAVNGPADLAGRKVIVGSGTNQERILLGWNEDNRAAGRPQAQPVYLTDDASGNLYIQSGRADIFFGPQSVAAYKAALNGQTRVVGLGPKKAWVATTTKKGNGLVYALQAALDGAIARGEYQQVLARWGEQGEAVAQSVVNPPGITY